MDKNPTQLGVAELHGAAGELGALCAIANRRALAVYESLFFLKAILADGTAGVQCTHVASDNALRTVRMTVAEFSIDLATRIREFPADLSRVLDRDWDAIYAHIGVNFPELPCEQLFVFADQVLIDAKSRVNSWFDFGKAATRLTQLLQFANRFVRAALRTEREAAEAVYSYKGDGTDSARLSAECHKIHEPLAVLEAQEEEKLRAQRNLQLYQKTLRECRKLPPKLRAVAELKIEGETLGAIAEALKISPGTAATRWRAAHAKLLATFTAEESALLSGRAKPKRARAAARKVSPFPTLPKVDFGKFVGSLPAEERRVIWDAERQYNAKRRTYRGTLTDANILTD